MGQIVDMILRTAKSRLDLTDLFRRNACMKHGVPWVENQEQTVNVVHTYQNQPATLDSTTENTVTRKTEQTTESQTVATQVDPQTVAKVAEKTVGVAKKLWPWITAAVLAAGGSGAGLTYLFSGDGSNPTPPAPQTQVQSTDTQSKTSESDHSLLQYLEDNGRHLPKGHKFDDGNGATTP